VWLRWSFWWMFLRRRAVRDDGTWRTLHQLPREHGRTSLWAMPRRVLPRHGEYWPVYAVPLPPWRSLTCRHCITVLRDYNVNNLRRVELISGSELINKLLTFTCLYVAHAIVDCVIPLRIQPQISTVSVSTSSLSVHAYNLRHTATDSKLRNELNYSP